MDFGMNFRKRVTHLLLILFLFTGNASADNKQSIMVGVSKFAPLFLQPIQVIIILVFVLIS